MLLAVNYSPEVAELLSDEAVAFDFFKVPDWDEVIQVASERKPVEVHFPLQLGASQQEVTIERAAELMTATGTTKLNLHVAPSRERFPDVAVGDVGAAAKSRVTDALLQDLEPYLERFGAGNVVLENLPYRGPERGLLRAGVEPEVLTAVIAASGAGLLLDLAHAAMTAAALSQDLTDYLERLPLASLSDLHVSGVGEIEGQLRDHMPLSSEDWELLTGALSRVQNGIWPHPRSLAFEYGGVGPVFAWRTDGWVLAEQLPRLAEMVAACGPAPN